MIVTLAGAGDRVRLEVEQLGCIDAGVVAGAPIIPLTQG